MGSGALCISGILHEKTPARQGGKGCRLSLRRGRACGFNPPAFKRTCRIRGVRRLLWKAVRLLWAVTCMRRTPPVRAEKGAGSACPAPRGRELYAGSTRPRPPYWRGAAWVQAQPAGLSLPRGILKEEGKNPLLAAKKVGGAAGGALYWILITR